MPTHVFIEKITGCSHIIHAWFLEHQKMKTDEMLTRKNVLLKTIGAASEHDQSVFSDYYSASDT